MALMPRPTAPISGPGGLPTREWLDYLRELAGAGDLSGINRAIAELQQQVAALEKSGASGEVLGIGAIQNIGSLADGLVRLDLRQIDDAGGGELLKILRDAYGRVAGTSAATTDDLAEGAGNLYFTDARAAAAAPVQSVAGELGAVTAGALAAALNLGAAATADLTALADAADDAAAAVAGVAVGKVYRNGSALMVRVA